MSSFQACFDSWDKYGDQYFQTFAGDSLTVENFELNYGRFYDRKNGTSLSTAVLNSRIITVEHEFSKTRTRTLTLYSGELRSLVSLIKYLRAGYPLAVSYYVIMCYDPTDCISSSVFSLETLPNPGSFALEDINRKLKRYETITPRPCHDRSISVVLRELL